MVTTGHQVFTVKVTTDGSSMTDRKYHVELKAFYKEEQQWMPKKVMLTDYISYSEIIGEHIRMSIIFVLILRGHATDFVIATINWAIVWKIKTPGMICSPRGEKKSF